MKTIIFTTAAARQLDALPAVARTEISEALAHYAVEGIGDVKRLSGRDGFRLRVGAYRVIFDEDAATILAVYVGRRATTTYKRN
jgi:mRNA interferase RelE/StbE